MSRTRSCTSKHPGRSSVYVPGFKPHSSEGQPTVAAIPNDVLVLSPWNTHPSMPSSWTTFGASSAHFLAHGSEHVRRLDHVVVDADEDHVVKVHGVLLS